MACFSPRMRKAPLSTVGEFSALKRIWPKVVVFAPPSPLGSPDASAITLTATAAKRSGPGLRRRLGIELGDQS
jgi:hypothetical protein